MVVHDSKPFTGDSNEKPRVKPTLWLFVELYQIIGRDADGRYNNRLIGKYKWFKFKPINEKNKNNL